VAEANTKDNTSTQAGTTTHPAPAGKTLTVTYVKSAIGYSQDQKAAVRSLGFKRLRQTLQLPDTPQVRGQINKVKHLVRVEEGASEG
jgi:large subunit ribosomal protein L30